MAYHSKHNIFQFITYASVIISNIRGSSTRINYASDNVPIHLYMEDKIINNRKLNWRGIWLVEYMGYSYTTVNYKTSPCTIINWETPDSFYVKHYNRIYPTPIINPQTLIRRHGAGKQTLYLSEDMIGNIYTIYGYLKNGDKVTKEEDFEGCSKLKSKVH